MLVDGLDAEVLFPSQQGGPKLWRRIPDDAAYKTVVEVIHLLRPPRALFRPGILALVLRRLLRFRGFPNMPQRRSR